jgi:hypothetical protein
MERFSVLLSVSAEWSRFNVSALSFLLEMQGQKQR